jgi:hypothetical protein
MSLQWACNFPEAAAKTFSVYQGETVTFEPTFRINGKPADLDIEGIYYQTNGMADSWWKIDGNTFTPTNDVGAAAYRFFVSASGESGVNYRANGILRMLPSPGFQPNTIALPIQILDFDAIEVRNAPFADSSAIEALQEAIEETQKETQLVYRLYSGSNVVFEVTNYNSRAKAPSLRLLCLTETNTYETIWTETNGMHRTLLQAQQYANEVVNNASKNFAPRAWSQTTSGLGEEAPSQTTWISTPTTVIAGGFEPQKVITASGTFWIITSNGMNTISTNRYGYIDIAAADGKSAITIEKTDSYMVGVAPDSIVVNGNTVTITVPVVSNTHPFLRYTPTLSPAAWGKEEDGFTSPIEVNWSGTSGAWSCSIETTASQGFFAFEFLQEGGTKIRNNGVVDVSGGILCTDGIHRVRPVYSNGSVTWEVF